MAENDDDIAYCDACKNPMHVAGVAPFTNVSCPHCGEHNRVKRQFGPYTLVRRHAVGGMSMVFGARDSTLEREVALKILSEEYSADERRIAAFEEEARITASFSHPHVVRVLKTGKAFGRFFIAMELVSGGHFEHQIRERGKIPEAEMLPLAIEVAQGLKAAHAAGLIHRDVKPGNILLDGEGRAKLVDFGLALVTQGGKAQATELWATPYYVPPETIEGKPEDFRSDIYAFGATLYHALAGKPSCGEETMATNVLREAKRNVVPLGVADPSLSADVCGIVDRAMAYEAADRFSSYDELIAQLEAAVARLKIGAPSAGQVSKESARLRAEQSRRVKWIAGVSVAGGLAVLGAWLLRPQSKVEVKQPDAVAVAADEAVPVIPVNASASDIAQVYRDARTALSAGDFAGAAEGFGKLSENPALQDPTRSWVWVERVLVSYLSGDGDAARAHATGALRHAEGAPGAISPLKESLLRVLRALPELAPIIKGDAAVEGAGSSEMMGWMIAGLKNWEQGMLDAAVDCFKAVVAGKPGAEDLWLADYQKIAADYLADYEVLLRHRLIEFPGNADACVEEVAALEAAISNLKTKGRARFNIRAMQLDLTRHAKLLDTAEQDVPVDTAQPEPVVVDLATVMAGLEEHAKNYRFGDVVEYLSLLPKDPEGASRASLTAVCALSEKFLTDLERDLGQEGVRMEFEMQSGKMAKAVEMDALGTLRITDAEGEVRSGDWSEISPDGLISLHRTLVKRETDNAERLRRHHRAIAFDWLVGNRERAVAAATSLSQTSTEFRTMWEETCNGLP